MANWYFSACRVYAVVLVDLFNEAFFARPEDEVVSEYKQVMDGYLGAMRLAVEPIRALHRLGYLPLHIKALDEGSKVPMTVPVLNHYQHQPEFFWLVNYWRRCCRRNWKASTNATIAHHYRLICERWAQKTCSDQTHLDFQCHDFSFRGMSGLHDTMQSGCGHLSFKGTDQPSIAAVCPRLLHRR
jgi:nicotinamide phosphoribosyltransferase